MIKAKTVTHEFNLEEMKQMIAATMDLPIECIRVEYIVAEVGGDPMDRYPGSKECVGVRVIVDNLKLKSGGQ